MIAFLSQQEQTFDKLNPVNWSWAAIGDSCTSATDVTNPQRYTDLYAASKTMTMTNLGESGQTLTTHAQRTGLKTKLGTAFGKDLITVLAGTNDWSFNIPLGSGLASNEFTIKSCVNYFIDQIRENSPASIILFLLPSYRTAGLIQNEIGLTLKDYNNAIRERCIMKGVRYIDLYDTEGLEAENIGAWSNDALHPNSVGHIAIKDILTNYFI